MFSYIIDKWGLKTAIILFIVKTVWSFFFDKARKFVEAVDANTKAINQLTGTVSAKFDQLDSDLQIAFHNIRMVNGGKIDMPGSKRDQ